MSTDLATDESHLVYMTRGDTRAMITQSFGRVIAEDADSVTIDRPSPLTGRPITVARVDLHARTDGRRLTEAEMLDVIAAHRSEQRI